MNIESVRTSTMEVLQLHGWTILDSVAIARKEFVTAVGNKEALAYLYDQDGYDFKIQGDYLSEGNNVLAAGTLIPVEANVSEVRKLAEEFCQYADAAIDRSYARRLYLKYDVKQ